MSLEDLDSGGAEQEAKSDLKTPLDPVARLDYKLILMI